VYSALPSITGKLELEYEGELKGGESVAREIIRSAVARVYNENLAEINLREVVAFFNAGGTLKLEELTPSARLVTELSSVPGLMEKVRHLGLGENEEDAMRAAAAEFILEGLYSLRRISRNEEVGYLAEERKPSPSPPERAFRRGGGLN